MKIGLIDVDGHNYPNIPLMKYAAYHKAQGDCVEWYDPLLSGHVDRVYMSKVFSFTGDYAWPINADEVIRGGSGYCIKTTDGHESYHTECDAEMPDVVGHFMPDYSIYNIQDTAYGFLTRGCPRACPFCHVAAKEGRNSKHVADLDEFRYEQKNIVLCDPNILACIESERLLKSLTKIKATVDFNQGLDVRLITPDNIGLINAVRMDSIHFAWDLMEQSDDVMRGLKLYARKGKVRVSHRSVFVLVNYNTAFEEDLFRVYKLREMGYRPFVMVYNREHASKQLRDLASWTNNVVIWRSCDRFEDYDVKKRYERRVEHENCQSKLLY